ncbi:hypothetical protein [Nannocystis exedens]|uniref:hypothetical protein n=1 Tax=Nannocystis exedens TaxID=54 RepID=UPI0011602903|nr:hypothetical protein [Nannocystis exedens]
MSIYGPPAPPDRDHARKASAHLTRVVIAVIVIGSLVVVAVMGLLAYQRRSSDRLEVDRAEAIRLETGASLEAQRLQSADFLPEPPARPNSELPPPLQTAEPLPRGAYPRPVAGADDTPTAEPTARPQVAEPLTAPLELERKTPPAAEPARLQTAEILR